MRERISKKYLFVVYAAVMIIVIGIAQFGSKAVTAMVESAPIPNRTCIIIDAGHGGIDGGATSCSRVLESQTNLQIALRLNDLMQFLGYDTRMIRTTDTSIHTEGSTIAAQKVSDLKNRVKIVNETANSILVSIHQNTFTDSRYSGTQVFYAKDAESRKLAEAMQSAFVQNLDQGSNRKCKPSDGIYLMQHIQKPGILIECGFISNPQEDAKLQNPDHQKKIICVIASTISKNLDGQKNDAGQ